MKKLVLALSIFFTQASFSQGVLMVDSVNHSPTWVGDSLIFYLRTIGSGWGVDTGNVSIVIDGNVVSSKAVANLSPGNHQWTIVFPFVNATSTYITFNGGSSGQYDAFYIQIDNSLDIISPFINKTLISKKYYSLSGTEMIHPSDAVIEESKYNDGTIIRRKIFVH